MLLGTGGNLWRKWVGLGREEKYQGNKYITIGTGLQPPCCLKYYTILFGPRNESDVSKSVLSKGI